MAISLNAYIDMAKNEQECDSYNHLAERMGISRGGLSHIRNGGTVSQDTLTKIALLSRETKKMWVRLASQAQ